MVENEQADDDVAEPDGPEATVAGDGTKSPGTEFEQVGIVCTRDEAMKISTILIS